MGRLSCIFDESLASSHTQLIIKDKKMKQILMMLFCASLVVSCIIVPPGHDRNGPGNSENAPGHNKHGSGPGNSENAPGQNKNY